MIARSALIRHAAASSAGASPAISSAGAGLGAETGEGVRQQVGPELRRAAAAVGQLGEADLGRAGASSVVMAR